MNYRRPCYCCGLLIATLALGGCESCETPTVPVMPDPRLRPAALMPDDFETVPRIVEVKVPVPSPQLRPIGVGTNAPATQTGAAAIAAANAGATTQPTTDGFLNAIQYYDYAPGVVYTAITSPGYVTTIALRPGEKLITAAAGDTVRWLVDSVQSGSGETAQTLLLVKPRKAGLQTNLLITTDQRIYTLDLTSVDTGVVSHHDRLELSLWGCRDDPESSRGATGGGASNGGNGLGSVQGQFQLPDPATKALRDSALVSAAHLR